MTTTDLARTTDSPDPAALESLVLPGDIAGPPRAEGSALPRDVPHPRPRPRDAAPLAYLKPRARRCSTSPAARPTARGHARPQPRIIDGPRVMDLAGTKLVYAVCRATLPGGRYETTTATVPLVDPVNVLMKCETK